jgi:hypothetical protein
MDSSQLKKMKRFRRGFRFMGAIFSFVGGFLFISFVSLLFDPTATITWNGVPTNEFGPKLQGAIFASEFLVAGLLCLLVPTKISDRLFIWRQSLLSSWFRK